MKILIAHYAESVPSDPGYLETRYAALSRQLISMGHQVLRVAPSFMHFPRLQRPAGSFKDAVFGDFQVVPTRSYERSRSIKRINSVRDYQRGALSVAIYFQPDLIVSGVPPVGMGRLFREQLPNAKIFLDLRDLWPDAQIGSSSGLMKKIFLASLPILRYKIKQDFLICDGLVSLSGSYLQWAKKISPRLDSIGSHIAPLGAPMIFNDPDKAVGKTGVIFVGTVSELFDFETLIAGWRVFENKHAELASANNLLICGDGPVLPYIKTLAQDLDTVKFLGHVSRVRASKLMQNSLVGVAPYLGSDFHTLPNKFFEYMAAGLPVVTTLSGDANKIISDYDLGFVSGSATAEWYSDKFHQILSDDLTRQKLSEGALAAAKVFDRDAISLRFAEFITSV